MKYQNFYLKIFLFLVVKFAIYLNRRVFVMALTRLVVFDKWSHFRETRFCSTKNLKPRLYALSLPLGVNLPLWVNNCPTLLNTPMGKWLRLYVF